MTPADGDCRGEVASLTCAMLGEAALGGDAFAVAEIDRIAGRMPRRCANLITLVSPEVVAIGGGVANLGELLWIRSAALPNSAYSSRHRGHIASWRASSWTRRSDRAALLARDRLPAVHDTAHSKNTATISK